MPVSLWFNFITFSFNSKKGIISWCCEPGQLVTKQLVLVLLKYPSSGRFLWWPKFMVFSERRVDIYGGRRWSSAEQQEQQRSGEDKTRQRRAAEAMPIDLFILWLFRELHPNMLQNNWSLISFTYLLSEFWYNVHQSHSTCPAVMETKIKYSFPFL